MTTILIGPTSAAGLRSKLEDKDVDIAIDVTHKAQLLDSQLSIAIESWLSNSCALCVTSMAISTSLSSSLLRSPAAEVGPINMVVMPLSAAMSNNARIIRHCCR